MKLGEKNSDCQIGGFNPCGSCGQIIGTEMYHLCYSPNPLNLPETPVPTQDVPMTLAPSPGDILTPTPTLSMPLVRVQ